MFKRTSSFPIHVGIALGILFLGRFVISASEDLLAQSSSPGEVSNAPGIINTSQQTSTLPNKAPTLSTKQSYVGTNQCFSCHRPQTDQWSETKHARAFSDIPKKYQNDSGCLKCHVTGFGKSGGYTAGTEKDLLMVGCEACHGPGAMHVDAAKRFVLADPGEEATIEKEMKETITKTPSDKVCIGCHVVQAHQQHPAYEGQVFHKVASRPLDECNPPLMMANYFTLTTGQPNYSSQYSIKTCGGCHYDQYKQWGAEKHSALSAMLPAKYSTEQACRTCHSNAAAVTVKNMANDPHHHLIGVACETCHGPALEHIQFNKQFISAPPLGPKLEQEARHSIRQGKPLTTCIQCHVRQTHKRHPEYDRK